MSFVRVHGSTDERRVNVEDLRSYAIIKNYNETYRVVGTFRGAEFLPEAQVIIADHLTIAQARAVCEKLDYLGHRNGIVIDLTATVEKAAAPVEQVRSNLHCPMCDSADVSLHATSADNKFRIYRCNRCGSQLEVEVEGA